MVQVKLLPKHVVGSHSNQTPVPFVLTVLYCKIENMYSRNAIKVLSTWVSRSLSCL